MRSLNDYASFVEPDLLDSISRLAGNLKGLKVQHINSTYVGGGVAEILHNLVPLMKSVGLAVRWDVIKAKPSFYKVTKAFHNAFHGKGIELTRKMMEIYRKTSKENLMVVDEEADFIIIHDQQPLGLVERRPGHKGKWIWYCHIDPVNVDEYLWGFLGNYARQCDGAIYHLEDYAKNLGNKQFFLPPAIDPLSDKNREISSEEEKKIRKKLRMPKNLPVILQVSRFDRLKNPFGLVDAYLKLSKDIPCVLVLAGGAADDDPEGRQVLGELIRMINKNPRIRVLNLPPDSALEINVLQRAADIIVQNSEREGFGLTVTEALWKGKPVIATPVGGIKVQVIHEKTGLLASNTNELISSLKRLLQDRDLAVQLGCNGREHARKNFIIPVYLYRWLELMNGLFER